MRALLLLVAGCASAPREEVVEIPGEKLKIHLVHVPVDGTSLRPYALAKFETAWKEFQVFYREDLLGPRRSEGVTRPTPGLSWLGQVGCPSEFLEADRPFIEATWYTAMTYCDWLTAATGRKFRLPTHAEWEHAARAGEKGEPAERGWRNSTSGNRTHPPGTSKANAWGLHDALGNVWELVLEPLEPGALKPAYRGGAWDSPDDEASFGGIQPLKPEWYASDPNRPRSLWWLTDGFNQGFRVAQVGDGAAMKASKAYARCVPAKVLTHARKPGRMVSDRVRTVTVEVRNSGDGVIEELEVRVFFLDPRGKPHLLETEGLAKPGRPNFNWAYPVLASGLHRAVADPLRPNQARTFEVEVPETDDEAPEVDAEALGADVTWVRLALTK